MRWEAIYSSKRKQQLFSGADLTCSETKTDWNIHITQKPVWWLYGIFKRLLLHRGVLCLKPCEAFFMTWTMMDSKEWRFFFLTLQESQTCKTILPISGLQKIILSKHHFILLSNQPLQAFMLFSCLFIYLFLIVAAKDGSSWGRKKWDFLFGHAVRTCCKKELVLFGCSARGFCHWIVMSLILSGSNH